MPESTQMSDRRTLVFGDDGSPAADVAWLFVNSHRWPGWRLEVVTAYMPEIPGVPRPGSDSQLHPWDPPQPRTAFSEAQFDEVVALTADADPRLVLSRESDLLVIGPRGPGLLKSLHLGSTADWLLLHPPAPLLIARHGHTVRTVVVCADGSPHADRVASVLADLPWAEQLRITILAVDDGRIDVDTATGTSRDRLQAAGAAVDVCVHNGKPTAVIHRHLLDAAPDLVALGTRGLTGLRHLRLGSTASAVARTATCSVLVACDEAEYGRTVATE
jgi:nucleotide-binding universal stress UspA family protein